MVELALELTPIAITKHDLNDKIAKAIMAMPLGGPAVEITVDGDRHILHHWKIQDAELTATWAGHDELMRAARIPLRMVMDMPLRVAAPILWRRLVNR